MKKEVILGLASIVLVLGLTWRYDQQYELQVASLAKQVDRLQTNTDQKTADNQTTPAETLSIALVATHNVSGDCWIIINSSVYDVSSYFTLHPGGANQIIPYCGKDATTAFATKDGTGTHSALAQSELAKLLIGPIGRQISQSGTDSGVAATPPPAPVIPVQQPAPQIGAALTTATIAQHATSGSCWIIISNTVYAVSGYLNLHPGGANRIIPYCGKDATQAFQTRSGSGSHSSNAYSILNNYRIGVLNSDVTPQQIQSAEQAPAPAAAQRGDDDEEEDDD